MGKALKMSLILIHVALTVLVSLAAADLLISTLTTDELISMGLQSD